MTSKKILLAGVCFILVLNTAVSVAQTSDTIYHSTGEMYIVGSRIEGVEVGKWMYFRKSGVLDKIGYYSTDKILWKVYTRNGCLIETYTTIMDSALASVKQGVSIGYFCNGKVRTYGNYLMGSRHGSWSEWDSLGALIEVVNYNEGKLDGEYVKFDSLGRLSVTGFYDSGQPVGTWSLFEYDLKQVEYGEFKLKERSSKITSDSLVRNSDSFGDYKWTELERKGIWRVKPIK